MLVLKVGYSALDFRMSDQGPYQGPNGGHERGQSYYTCFENTSIDPFCCECQTCFFSHLQAATDDYYNTYCCDRSCDRFWNVGVVYVDVCRSDHTLTWSVAMARYENTTWYLHHRQHRDSQNRTVHSRSVQDFSIGDRVSQRPLVLLYQAGTIIQRQSCCTIFGAYRCILLVFVV